MHGRVHVRLFPACKLEICPSGASRDVPELPKSPDCPLPRILMVRLREDSIDSRIRATLVISVSGSRAEQLTPAPQAQVPLPANFGGLLYYWGI